MRKMLAFAAIMAVLAFGTVFVVLNFLIDEG
jgi:hypothetical protein